MRSVPEQIHRLRERLKTIDIERTRLTKEIKELTTQLEHSLR